MTITRFKFDTTQFIISILKFAAAYMLVTHGYPALLACSTDQAEAYVSVHKSLTDVEARAALVDIITNGDTNRDKNGRFAPGKGSSHDLLKTPAVHDGLKNLYTTAGDSYQGANKQEHSITIDKEGNPSEIATSHDSSKTTVSVHKENGKVTDQAIIHTHPKGTDPHPSDADVQIAKKTGIPNYELSQNQLWVANPDGSTAKVADVEWKNNDLSIKWKS
jgi:proteasome lid subunit RPN8/RPN11